MARPESFRQLMNKALNPKAYEYEVEQRRENARARYHAKRLSKKLNIPLTTGFDDVGWHCWVETDLELGEWFSTSWSEVLSKLEECERMLEEQNSQKSQKSQKSQ